MWFIGANPLLDNDTPANATREDRLDEVNRAAQVLIDDAFSGKQCTSQSSKERTVITISAHDASESLVALIGQVNDAHSAITITTPAGSGVLISEADYLAWKQNMHLLAMPSNARLIVDVLERSEREHLTAAVERIIGRDFEPGQIDTATITP